MSADLVTAAANAHAAMNSVRKAFGAPGDYGYGTKEGDALLGLYRQMAALEVALRTAGEGAAKATGAA